MTTTVEKRKCEDCWGDKQVGEEIKPKGRVCFACQRRKKLEYERDRYHTDPEVNARRKESYKKRYQENRSKIVKARAEKMRNSKELQEKQREYIKAWRERLYADPVKHQEFLKVTRERKAKARENPETRVRDNENRRISRRKKWEAEGRELEPISMERYKRYNKTRRMLRAVGPLRPHIDQWLLTHTMKELSDLSGVPERRILEFRKNQESASLESIEKLCYAMNIMVDDIFYMDDDSSEFANDGDLCA